MLSSAARRGGARLTCIGKPIVFLGNLARDHDG
jgi:hypothetical protein